MFVSTEPKQLSLHLTEKYKEERVKNVEPQISILNNIETLFKLQD